MDLIKTIMNSADLGTIKNIASKLGLEERIVQVGIFSMLPEITAGLEQNIQQEGGADALVNALDEGSHETYVDDPEAIVSDAATEDGNKILGHALGSKDKSREVAKAAADETGIDLGKLKQMLPMVAALAMGGLKKSGITGGGKSAGDGKADSGSSGIVGQLSSMLSADDLKKVVSGLF